MNNNQNKQAVVRDPGTVFLYWDSASASMSTTECLLLVRNLSSGREEKFALDYQAGKYYLHTLLPDSYYALTIAQYYEKTGELQQILDFGVVHTFKNSISNLSDPDPRWSTDSETLLRLTGTELEGITSSNGKYT